MTFFLHELFHGVQPQLGLGAPALATEHLDAADGRGWLRLEWRALARALRESGVLVARDGRSRRVSAPVRRDDVTFTGDGWTFKAAAGWVIREGARRGDYEVVRQQP